MTEKEMFRELNKYTHLDLPDFYKKARGKRIRYGNYRKVFELKFAPNYVIKIERFADRRGQYSNIMEFRNWINNADWIPLSKYLMPVITMGGHGDYLIMPKAILYHEDPKLFKKFPKRIPQIITDVKRENWGFYDGRFVCLDYPFLVIPGNIRFKRTKFHA